MSPCLSKLGKIMDKVAGFLVISIIEMQKVFLKVNPVLLSEALQCFNEVVDLVRAVIQYTLTLLCIGIHIVCLTEIVIMLEELLYILILACELGGCLFSPR